MDLNTALLWSVVGVKSEEEFKEKRKRVRKEIREHYNEHVKTNPDDSFDDYFHKMMRENPLVFLQWEPKDSK